MNFENFVAPLNLRHFQPNELMVATENVRNNVRNTEPPQALWGNIVPTILILDRLREFLGVPVHLKSVYRAPTYNATIENAAPRSLHQAFAAADIWVGRPTENPVTPRTIYEILRLWRNQWFQSPVQIKTAPVEVPRGWTPHAPLNVREADGIHEFEFQGGIFRYDNFVHIDTRGINVGN